MTIKEIFRQARCEAEKNVRNNELNTIIYMSGSKQKKSKMKKMLKEYKEESALDCELGVISRDIHEFEMKAAEILEKSLEKFIIF